MSTSKSCVSIDMHYSMCKFLRVKSQKLAKTLSNIHTNSDWPYGGHGSILTIPIDVCYYLELRSIITSSSRVQVLLTKAQ